MSDTLTPSQYDELCKLITALHEKCITEEQKAQLEAYVTCNKEAGRIYVQYSYLYAHLRWRMLQESEQISSPGKPQASPPVLGFLGDAFQQGLGFFSRGIVISLVVAIGLPLMMLVIMGVKLADQRPAPAVPESPTAVARVDQTHECVWEDKAPSLATGTDLFSGQNIRLEKGLLKIAFNDGASVILEGPVVFTANLTGEGFLQSGKLVASVPRGAEGFTIKTPATTVIDYGTEFGIAVDELQKTSQVQVFQGEVALENPENQESKDVNQNVPSRHLKAGNAVRVELSGRKGKMVVREIAASPDLFVRLMPSLAKPTVIANFSGGNGVSEVDQYPGAAGSGWADAWNIRKEKGFEFAASVEKTNPLFGGGDYLHGAIACEPGTPRNLEVLERRLELKDRIDLTKPYVVSFNFRLDDFGGFTNPGEHLILCNHAKPASKLGSQVGSGWHVRLDAREFKNQEKCWTFVSGDGKSRKNEARINSGIPAREGVAYSFRVVVEPEARKWTPSISVDGGEWTTFQPMGMRAVQTPEECDYWPYFYVYWVLSGENQGDDRDKVGFSIDSIRVTAVD